MDWQGVVGHDEVVERFRRSIERGRLASTFLFVGPEGIGKRTFALKLAQAMLCSQVPEAAMAPCGSCADCQQVVSNTHPDLQFIQKPAERAFIPLDAFIGDRDHRMRAGLCHFISLTPAGGKRRIAIIDDADWLNQEGANSLLKTLEEPSPGAVIVLIGTSVQRQLPTIRSRSQVVQFQPLRVEQVQSCLLALGFEAEQALAMASRADGSIARAIEQAEDSNLEFRREFWPALAEAMLDRRALANMVTAYMDAGGKDTAEKRKRLRRVLDAAVEFYRAAARRDHLVEVACEPERQAHVDAVIERGALSGEVWAALIERCLDAIRQTNSNANLNMLVEAWVCDLAVMTRTGQPSWTALSD